MSTHGEERPIELPDEVADEGISAADAAQRLDEHPEEQRNYPDRPLADRALPEDT